jgi:hypothetical protein
MTILLIVMELGKFILVQGSQSALAASSNGQMVEALSQL